MSGELSVVTDPTQILFFNTGGTLGMVRGEGGGLVPAKSGEELIEAINIPSAISLNFLEAPVRLDSTNVTYADRLIWAEMIAELYPDHDAIVVAHGTDSIAQSAGALSLIYGESLQKPLVIVGAQNTLDESGGDTRTQIESALIAAKLLRKAHVVGVYSTANSLVYDGPRVKKVNEAAKNFLDTPGRYPIAQLRDTTIVQHSLVRHYDQRIDARGLKLEKAYEQQVAALKVTADVPPYVLDAIVEKGIKGVIIEALGSGNVPDREILGTTWIDAIARATEQGVIVGIISPFDDGRVDMSRYDLGKRAAEAGAIGMESLTPAFGDMKFRQALGMFPLDIGFGMDKGREAAFRARRGKIAKYLQTDLMGEMLPGIIEDIY